MFISRFSSVITVPVQFIYDHVWVNLSLTQKVVSTIATLIFSYATGRYCLDKWRNRKVVQQTIDTLPNDTCEGTVIKGLLQGLGKKKDALGNTFEGFFKDHELNGFGKKTASNGIISQGHFVNGILTGFGTTYNPQTQMKMTGEFISDKLNGFGQQSENGFSVTGDFEANALKNFGRIRDVPGNTYIGEITDEKPTGRGLKITAAGVKFEGYFIDGQLQNGKKLQPNGDWYEGTFDKGNLVLGRARITMQDGSIYEGKIEKGQYSIGRLTYPNKVRYEGEFQNNVAHGDGKLTLANGEIHVSKFVNGIAEGKGKIIHADLACTTVEGIFEKGVFTRKRTT